MNLSLSAQITRQLALIRDLFRAVRDMTTGVLNDFSLEALDTMVRQREVLLLRIDSEKEALIRIHGSPYVNGHAAYRDIRNSIDDIRRYDQEAAALVRQRMDAVQRELSSLSDTSRAARVYTSNSRI